MLANQILLYLPKYKVVWIAVSVYVSLKPVQKQAAIAPFTRLL